MFSPFPYTHDYPSFDTLLDTHNFTMSSIDDITIFEIREENGKCTFIRRVNEMIVEMRSIEKEDPIYCSFFKLLLK